MQFTDYSIDVLEYAIVVARSLRARLHLLHVITSKQGPGFDALNEFFYTIGNDPESSVTRSALDQMDLLKVHIRDESVSRGIIRYATDSEIDMIMMAAQTAQPDGSSALSQNTLRVLENSPCPVMIIQWPSERSQHQSRFELTLQEIKKEISTRRP